MDQGTSNAVKTATARLQRLAIRAGIAGFLTSATLLGFRHMLNGVEPGYWHLQSSIEAVCVLLWPSAVLMLGAQTTQGGVALFVLSACLNAGYFVFAAMFLAAVADKVRARVQVGAPVAVTRQSSASMTARLRSPRPAA
jgi:hypothetical protein